MRDKKLGRDLPECLDYYLACSKVCFEEFTLPVRCVLASLGGPVLQRDAAPCPAASTPALLVLLQQTKKYADLIIPRGPFNDGTYAAAPWGAPCASRLARGRLIPPACRRLTLAQWRWS